MDYDPMDETDGDSFVSHIRDFSRQLIGNVTPADNTSHCNYYRPKNSSSIIIIPGGYEGIPQNLLINVVTWVVLIVLFSVLRKNAWNYGRMALLQRRERWTHIFYRRKDAAANGHPESSRAPSFDAGMFSWICVVFRIKDDQIRSKCGDDAVQYLSFQRHVIVLMTIVTVVSLGVALPVNFQGGLKGDEKQFGHTTLSNLDPSSWYIWLHVALAILFVPIAICTMRCFSAGLVPAVDSTVSRTLMVSHIPRSRCNKAGLLKHFRETYPECEVVDVQLAYNLAKLIKLDREREFALHARDCSESERTSGNNMVVRPFVCGNLCVCCDPCCSKSPLDASEYYTSEERRLAALVQEEKIKAIKRPVGVAFVTFATKAQATKVQTDDHRPNLSHRWSIDFAPRPDEINWGNLSTSSWFWYMRFILINGFLLIILLFLTTPAVVVNSLDFLLFPITSTIEKMSPVLSQFLPTLYLCIFSALLPVMVSYSEEWMKHWTKSATNNYVMKKTYIFLLLMVVILPSLGLTSARAFFEWAINPNETYRWECVFLPDNGAFFVNYVITSSFIGTALELIRFSDLFLYACNLCCARSKAEIPGVRRNLLGEFNFGVQYAWMLLHFSLVIVYSVSCPLITPFGLIYLLLKHFVDRYNIFYAYAPSRIDNNIHMSAINFVMTAFIIQQLTLFFFSLLRYGFLGVTIFALVGVCVTLVLVAAQAHLGLSGGMAPISYKHRRSLHDGKNQRDLREPNANARPTSPGAQDALLADTTESRPAGTVNAQVQINPYLPEVLREPQCNGPAHLMETIATSDPTHEEANVSRGSLNADDSVTV